MFGSSIGPLIDEKARQSFHDKLTKLVTVGTVAFAIGLIRVLAFDSLQWWGGILLIISLFGILHPIVNMGQLESSRNRVEAEHKKISYYREIKRMLENCSNYLEFILRYELKYGFLRRRF
ncbi:MAG: hypothetical protein RJA13_451 [Bacteroidota bacterium]